MPFSYSFDLDRNLLRQRLWDRVTAADLRELVIVTRCDPLYRTKLNILADLRDAQVDIKYNDMLDYAHFLSGTSEIGRQAIVVARQLEFGMARMYQQLTEQSVQRADLKVFRDMDEAEQWVLSG